MGSSPTTGTISNCVCSNELGVDGSATDTRTDTSPATREYAAQPSANCELLATGSAPARPNIAITREISDKIIPFNGTPNVSAPTAETEFLVEAANAS